MTGIDLDAASIEQAVAGSPADIDYLHADFLTYPFSPASFDVVVSVATLHHMDAVVGLSRMRELLRPGGVLAVVGLARSRMPADLPVELAAIVVNQWHLLTKRHWQHPSPLVWPPPESYPGMRRLARSTLPDMRYRRHLLWRYSLVWRKPHR